MALLVTNIIWSEGRSPLIDLAKRLQVEPQTIVEFELLKKSVDGRRRPPVWLANFRVVVSTSEADVIAKGFHGVRLFTDRDSKRYQQQDFSFTKKPKWPNHYRPIIVGAGPAGLFAALRFAEIGVPGIIVERGGNVEERHYSVRDFWRHRKLDTESNVVFGEGGAGAFSDGKIYTRRRDGELGWVFQHLVDCGADPEILQEGWAHLGTDKIRQILPKIRKRIIDLGGEFRFNTKVNRLIVSDNRCIGVQIGSEQLMGSPVVMATGHSARDSWEMMLDAGATAELRPIRIGARIEHPQKVIDMGRYGKERGKLPPASYRLVSKPPKNKKTRGAHTFCMCPGGTVVGASNEFQRVVVNGMSYSGRKAWWANSAIIVEVLPEDFPGKDPLAGVRFQDSIEQKAFVMGGGDFSAPAQNVVDFLAKKTSTELPRTSYPQGVKPGDLWQLFPVEIAEGLAEAILFFERKIPGFAGPGGVLIAPETRTTSPIRFVRDSSMQSSSLPGLMPIGEGAGYAGGIASAALEGFRAAQAEAHRYLIEN
jgi:uncharacterized protein